MTQNNYFNQWRQAIRNYEDFKNKKDWRMAIFWQVQANKVWKLAEMDKND